ncbi:hypothetical protein DL546_005747 [Coniochaeta pulveracea]|uniref:Uncharacterized protein n=1 Tax=Coniochaeta pulveracea TaxID=177199 RepID=A0A420YFX4_9PEZI|nr:hypothetical protein DL546_005747 [Coniochaeta pulveracea]
MSPMIASRIASQAARTAGKRQFSIMTSLRTLARSMEHGTPFQRLSQTQQSAPADWGRQFKRVGGNAVVYVPAIGSFLAWPYVASYITNDHIGQL